MVVDFVYVLEAFRWLRRWNGGGGLRWSGGGGW
ncbi:hypothetical protein A2U01_0117185, partial [Trifolium medium]|nr:hypothetical protein [Trifolium medium]